MDKKARNAAVRFLGAPKSAKVRRFVALPKWMSGWVGAVIVVLFIGNAIAALVRAI